MARDTIEAFNNNRVDYWVDYGTLLGIVRENDIIKHDNDIDICVKNNPENHIKIHKAFRDIKKGKYTFTFEPWGAYRIKKFLYWGDIYLINIKNNMYYDPTGKIPINLIGNCSFINWNGLPVRVPEKIHESLVWRYGKDYMTPKKGGKAINR